LARVVDRPDAARPVGRPWCRAPDLGSSHLCASPGQRDLGL